MSLLANVPLRRKLTLVILATTGLVMLLACAGLFVFLSLSYRANYVRDMRTVAKIFAENTAAAVTFDDAKSAEEALAVIRNKSRIVGAEVRTRGGVRLAGYGLDNAAVDQALAAPQSGSDWRFVNDLLVLSEPIILDEQQIGTLRVWSDYGAEYGELLHIYFDILASVLVLSLGVSYALSRQLQRLVSEPVLKLANTAKIVTERNDFSVRAKKLGRDEVGELTDAFNQMLAHVESQDGALRQSRQQFESLVNSINGIVWEADSLTFDTLFISPQVETILGHTREQCLAKPGFWKECRHELERERVTREMTQAVAAGRPFQVEYRMLHANGEYRWVQDHVTVLKKDGTAARLRGVTMDITAEKIAGEKLAEAQRELVDTSRFAGMAEVATGVLHNVGNVLNSINVSTTHVRERLRRSEIASLVKVGAMLEEQNGNAATFLTTNPKGKVVPGFIVQLAKELKQEHQTMLEEHDLLARNVEHIKEIVAMQQNYARVSGVLEKITLTDLVEDALLMNTAGLNRHGIQVIREFADLPQVLTDKHKVLQILVNLVHNAKYALDASGTSNRQLRIAVGPAPGGRVKVVVADNGIGIDPDNLKKVFSHGFTTRKDGHGFGLHSGAIAAKEMGGSLRAESAGRNQGATFTLELPMAVERTES